MMSKSKERTMQIIAAILCCALVVALGAIMLHSRKKFDNPAPKESSAPQSSQGADEGDSTAEPTTQPSTEPSTSPQIDRDVNSVSVLINKDYPVPEGWRVDPVNLKNGQQIDRRAYEDLQQMFDDARAEGLDPIVRSGYRSNATQKQVYNNKVAEYKAKGNTDEQAKALAGEWVAVPGTSEHESGLAADIVSSENKNLDESQENTKCQKWLMENSWKYGYILRYPKDKEAVTKIHYEPWHYRYVGKDVAKEIHDKGICLEEFYGLG